MNQFDLPSYSSESRKIYKLRMLLMHLEAEESSKMKGKQKFTWVYQGYLEVEENYVISQIYLRDQRT